MSARTGAAAMAQRRRRAGLGTATAAVPEARCTLTRAAGFTDLLGRPRPVREWRSVAAGVFVLVGIDDSLHERVTHHIAGREGAKRNAAHAVQDASCLDKPA